MNAAKDVPVRFEADTSMEGHNLHEASSPSIAGHAGLATAFNIQHGRYQMGVQDVLVGVLDY